MRPRSRETNNSPYNGALNQTKYYTGGKTFLSVYKFSTASKKTEHELMEKKEMISHPEKLRNKQKQSHREFAVRCDD